MAKKDSNGLKKPFYKLEEFWEAIAVVFVTVGNTVFSWGLEAEEVVAISIPFILLIINEIVVNKEEAKRT